MGKTTFIKEVLNIQENNRYSPWMNETDNYIEELYFHVMKKDKSKISSTIILLTVVFAILGTSFGTIISILLDLLQTNNYTCIIAENMQLLCNNNGDSSILILLTAVSAVIIIIIIIIFILGCVIKRSPVPFINLYKCEHGKYYENKLIEKIVDKIDIALVIEDVDRIDDIESLLLAVNKISEYIEQADRKKYILITGDYN